MQEIWKDIDGYVAFYQVSSPVIASNGTEVLRFESATDAEKMGFNRRNIANCCNNRYGCKTHKGYKWRYENE